MNNGLKKNVDIKIAPCIVLIRVLDVSILDLLEYLVQNYALYLYLMCQYLMYLST